MARRKANGAGTIYRRKDGRFEGAIYLSTPSEVRKRFRIYGRTWRETHDKLTELKMQAQDGSPLPDRSWLVGDYLDYWLEHVVRPARRPTTYELYEITIRLYLKPALGTYSLRRLTVGTLQIYLNRERAAGRSARQVQLIRAVLGAALSRAHREELVVRNVARLVELPKWERGEIQPWTETEASRFLRTSRSHPLYPAFVLIVYYGLRRGELLGLRWRDIDFSARVIAVRQQLVRVGGGIQCGPLKTRASRRDLPLLDVAEAELRRQQARQASVRTAVGARWHGSSEVTDLVFTTSSGLPIDPQNFARSFHRACREHGVRRIKLHHVRHTTATLLKRLRVPARDVQLILGHSRLTTTQEIYEHDDMADRREDLRLLEGALSDSANGSGSSSEYEAAASGSRQELPSNANILTLQQVSNSGGDTGTRTPDLLHAISITSSVGERATGVKRALDECRKQWLLGLVAVSAAVRT
jgi:integrase